MAFYSLNEAWYDYYRLFTMAFRDDPISQRRADRAADGVAVSQPDAIPDIRQDGSFWGGGRGQMRLRDSNDFIDLSSITNRQSRYKEYERLRYVAEIETALNIFADETCLAGDTLIATPFGMVPIQELAEQRNPDEKFLVYCYDFKKQDYTLGWASSPRKTKKAKTIHIFFENGNKLTCTPDHKILLRNGTWIEAGQLKYDDELMPFYRVPVNPVRAKLKTKQFPRLLSLKDGWKHERQFVDEWKLGENAQYNRLVNKCIRHVSAGLELKEVSTALRKGTTELKKLLATEGFTVDEVKYLAKRYPDRRIVVGIGEGKEIDVYDLTVDDYHNFATDNCIVHNCQKGDNNHTFEILTKNQAVKKELEYLFHKLIRVDKKIWNWAKNLYLFGDLFLEIVIDPENPKDGILKLKPLPPDSIYRIETTKGKLIEFQQSKEGPDYQSLARVEVTRATDADLAQATALRFAAEQLSHWRIGDDRKTFYPYGVSLIEAARGPAHQLRLMEDAMLVYRLTRAPERRVFYIDVAGIPPAKAEAFMERMKDALRKKKLYSNKSAVPSGASAVEERWHAPAQDEDYWIPIRPNVNTRIETLPGAQNLGEIDDAVYFRNKLMIALNIPRNYLNQEDPSVTKVTLSSQNVQFARFTERLQMSLADGLLEVAERHLTLRGYPEEWWEDLEIVMTPPSEYRELSRNDVLQARYSNASTLKSSQLMGDYDIYVEILKYQPDKAKEIAERNKMQKQEDMKINLIGQNPDLLGVGQPGQGDVLEVGGEAGGPNTMLGNQQQQQPQLPPPGQEGQPGQEQQPQGAPGQNSGEAGPAGTKPKPEIQPLPEPSEEDIKKYDLEIRDYSREKDEEEVDPVDVEGEL